MPFHLRCRSGRRKTDTELKTDFKMSTEDIKRLYLINVISNLSRLKATIDGYVHFPFSITCTEDKMIFYSHSLFPSVFSLCWFFTFSKP